MNTVKVGLTPNNAASAAGRTAFGEAAYHGIALVLGCAIILLANCQSRAQGFTLDWWDIDAGGTSSGGHYTLSGTIGQPDAGSFSGGQYMLSGGFWGTLSLAQTPTTLPSLTITLTPTNTVLLTWPSQSAGFAVQHVTDLNSSYWSDAGVTPVDDGTTSTVVLPPALGTHFYRLKK